MLQNNSKNNTFKGYPSNNDFFQMWVAVVGNSSTHGSFDAFISKVRDSAHCKKNLFNHSGSKAQIKVDGVEIKQKWPVFHSFDPANWL